MRSSEKKKDSDITDFTDITQATFVKKPRSEIFVFVVEHPPELAGKEFEVLTPGILGRSSSATINIPERSVSRKHLFFDPTSSSKGKPRIYIRDLNSTNGTFLNGQRISSGYIRPGDKISLGRVVIRFESRSPAEHKVRKMLKKEAELDPLTRLYNRRFFEHETNKMIYEGIPFSLIFIDIDDFKKINDMYGHQEGDKVLRELALAIKQSVRETDIPARYGGDEIVIVLRKAKEEIAEKILERINQKLDEMTHGGKTKRIVFSHGIAEFPKHGRTLQELIEYADKELYTKKKMKKREKKGINAP